MSLQTNRALRAVVIDDDESTRFFVRTALETGGFEVFDADRGERGIEVCSRVRPQVVLVDYRMPGMDGLECCGRLVSMLGSGVPIILLSGREDPSLPEMARQAGASKFVQKPTNWLFLARIARDLTGRAPAPDATSP